VSYYEILLLSVHILLCLALIALVLIQQGKGANAGAALAGGSSSVMGNTGGKSAITKATTYVALSFFVSSILLVRYYQHYKEASFSSADILEGSVLEQQSKQLEQAATTDAEMDFDDTAAFATEEQEKEIEKALSEQEAVEKDIVETATTEGTASKQ